MCGITAGQAEATTPLLGQHKLHLAVHMCPARPLCAPTFLTGPRHRFPDAPRVCPCSSVLSHSLFTLPPSRVRNAGRRDSRRGGASAHDAAPTNVRNIYVHSLKRCPCARGLPRALFRTPVPWLLPMILHCHKSWVRGAPAPCPPHATRPPTKPLLPLCCAERWRAPPELDASATNIGLANYMDDVEDAQDRWEKEAARWCDAVPHCGARQETYHKLLSRSRTLKQVRPHSLSRPFVAIRGPIDCDQSCLDRPAAMIRLQSKRRAKQWQICGRLGWDVSLGAQPPRDF